MKQPTKSPYETPESYRERMHEYNYQMRTIRRAYLLAAITGIALGILVVIVNYLWPR
jgi:hypothetical protein